jgi:uncharacterized protein
MWSLVFFLFLAGQTPVEQILDNARAQTKVTRSYDPAYVTLKYPNGDVPAETGVCTDVVVRALRGAGVDLQKEVHEDMKRSFTSYPRNWKAKAPDRNIDHRRVPNLQRFFERKGKALPITQDGKDYLPGDIVSWSLGGGINHIGVVSDVWSKEQGRYLMFHNIGSGAVVEDILFSWKITGHYRYFAP